jgi:hypothetical protein
MDIFAGIKKRAFVPPCRDERLFRGTTQIRTDIVRTPCRITGANRPRISSRPLRGEPSAAFQGGFQPMTASLCKKQDRYFPLRCVSLNVTYTIDNVDLQEKNLHFPRLFPALQGEILCYTEHNRTLCTREESNHGKKKAL